LLWTDILIGNNNFPPLAIKDNVSINNTGARETSAAMTAALSLKRSMKPPDIVGKLQEGLVIRMPIEGDIEFYLQHQLLLNLEDYLMPDELLVASMDHKIQEIRELKRVKSRQAP
jgi:hypothetical protein